MAAAATHGWTCEGCSTSETGEPAYTESHPGADLYFCKECTR